MAFVPYQNADGRDLPIEYLPCSNIKPEKGMAMTLVSGKLAKASGTTAPTYVCALDADAAVAAGTIIPVWHVEKDIIWKTECSASFGSVNIGDAVTIATDGLRVTGTTTSGVATVVGIDGTATGSTVKVRL